MLDLDVDGLSLINAVGPLSCAVASIAIRARKAGEDKAQCITPAHSVSHVVIRTSPNKKDFDGKVTFEYSAGSERFAIVPNLGLTNGGNKVKLYLSTYEPTLAEKIKINFGTKTLIAIRNLTEYLFLAPRNSEGYISILLASKSAIPDTYLYITAPSVGCVSPSSAASSARW